MRHMPRMIAVMTPFPRHVDADLPLEQAAALMRQEQIRHLPVLERGELVGVVSERDLERLHPPGHQLPDETELTAGDLCRRRPYCVDVGAPLDRVLDGMAERRLGSALVLRDGELVGIYTAVDACEALAELLRERFHPDPGFDAA